MTERVVRINNKTGLHARPAAEFNKLANSYPCEVFLKLNGKEINAKSIIGIMSLGVSMNDEVTVMTDGADEEASAIALADFLFNLNED